MKKRILDLRERLGGLGLAALLGFFLVGVFHVAVLKPLQERAARHKPNPAQTQAGNGGDQVGAVYAFLKRDEQTTDWLAKLHAIGAATGVELKSASYRTQQVEGRILRYEIVLPMAGTYGQIRDFLQRSTAEIPVMSVDHLTLRRENRNARALQAELRLTFHMVKS